MRLLNAILDYIGNFNLDSLFNYIRNFTYINIASIFNYNYLSNYLSSFDFNIFDLKELLNIIHSYNLNSIWISTGVTDFNLLFCLKVFFVIFFFCINICIIYTEYLDKNKKKKNNTHLQSGIHPTSQKAAKSVIFIMGAAASFLALKNEYKDLTKESCFKKLHQKLADLKGTVGTTQSELNQIKNVNLRNNLSHRLHFRSLEINIENFGKSLQHESDLQKALNAKKINWAETKDPKLKIEIAIEEAILNQLNSKNTRDFQNIMKDVQSGVKFSNAVCNADNEDKIIALLTEGVTEGDDDIKKSIIFSFNVEKLWNIFETLDAVSKLVCVMMFSSYFISSCVLGLVINIYGNYLLDRFQLEEKYPKVAIFIKYRKTVSKYYILLNLLTILMICSVNFILGISILSL
jgi:hypothetical protein